MRFISLLIYMVNMAITPGPNNFTMLYLGTEYGIKGTKKFLIASVSSLFVKTLLCGLFNIFLSSLIPQIIGYMKWVGAIYMVFLAYIMARSGWKDEIQSKEKYGSSYKDGIILQIFNIKSWIASLGIFATFIIPYPYNTFDIIGVTLIFTLLILLSSLIWGMFGMSLGKFISKYKKPFGIIMGLSLIYCAITAII